MLAILCCDIPGMKDLVPQGAKHSGCNLAFHSLRAQQINSHRESVSLIPWHRTHAQELGWIGMRLQDCYVIQQYQLKLLLKKA